MLDKHIAKYAYQSPLYREWLEKANNLSLFKDQASEQIDEFTSEELTLAASLGAMFMKETKEIKSELIRLLRTNNFTIRDVEDLLSDLRKTTIMSERKKADLEKFVLDIVDKSSETASDFNRTVAIGSIAGASIPLAQTRAAEKFSEGVAGFGSFYTNNYADRVLNDNIAAKVQKILALPKEEQTAALALLRSEIGVKFDANNYWQLVSNQIASKSYHYGYLKELDRMGQTHYTYKAIIDDKTTEICRHLNGKVFNVKTSLSLLESFSESDPVAATSLMPWLNKGDQENIIQANLSVDELQAQGVAIPGTLHANCRSTLVDAKGSIVAGGRFFF